jgi:uncharacterized protein YndB with AHSA1/START domain
MKERDMAPSMETTARSIAVKTTIVAEPGKPTIVMTRIFEAQRSLVFDVMTNPEHVKHWWGPRGTTVTVPKMDVRPGGAWRFLLRGPDGSEVGFGGVYREVSRPERVVQTFRCDLIPDAEAVETMVLTVEPGGRTRLTITVLHSSVENRDGHYRSMEPGASETLERLAELLQTM